jgi:23S rRNA (uracil1939-C5)-methyltransferase
VRRVKPRGGKPGLELEATVKELAPGGDGVAIATIDGERRAVFMAGVVTGDRVRVAVDLTKRPARGVVREVLERSVDRVDAPCPWASTCGGCDWMHVSHAAQLRAHEAHVRAALPSAWRETAIAVHAATSPFGYRTRVRLHVRATGGRAIVGMNEARTRDPVEVETCAVLHPALESARARVGALLEGAHGRGEVQVALGALGGDAERVRPAVIDLQWSSMLAPRCFAQIEAAVKEGWLAGARVTAGETRMPAKIGDATPWIEAGDGAPLKLAPGGFGQASDEGNVVLARRVAAIVGEVCANKADARVLELYAGAGNFTVMLAPLAKTIVAVESSREACEAARVNLAARGLPSRAKVVEADASSFAIPPQTHVVVLDPPRTGAREACTLLATSSAKHIVYVSCDPQTLARDLAILAPSFALQSVELFELFPQTSHVETVVHLARARP